MSIAPSGRRRMQVSQGALKHESIWDRVLSNVKQADAEQVLDQQQKADQSKGLTMQEIPGLGEAMDQGNDAGMNAVRDRATQETQMPEQEAPQESQGLDLGGGQFIDMSQALAKKVIVALGLDKRPGENWTGKTEITDDGQNVSAITIKLVNAPPKPTQNMVSKDGPPLGNPQPQQTPQPM